MVNDTPDLNPSLVSSDLEKLTMFNKGEEKASLIKNKIFVEIVYNSFITLHKHKQ